MVQLNTRYDSTLKKKVFILKGDEGYARTTDVLATIITSFNDYNTHISYCHVGLEIQVLREMGKSFLNIYNNDELLYQIPWNDSGMASIIDTDWNNKGVYWEDGKLIIGKKDDEHNINTGLFLPYEVENKIRVEYVGNKYCLGSEIKPIPLIVPLPNTFATTLTLSTVNTPHYVSIEDVDDISLLLECDNELTSAKSVRIYIDNVLVDTVSLTQDTPLTLDLSGENVSDGLHTVKAVWDGDDESYASESSFDISIGFQMKSLEVPSSILSGETGYAKVKVWDYFDEVWEKFVAIQEWIDGWGWSEPICQAKEVDGNGEVTLNPVQFSGKKWAIAIDTWHSELHDMRIITPSTITFNHSNTDVYSGTSDYMVANVMDGSDYVRTTLPITLKYTYPDNTSTTKSVTTNSNGLFTDTYYGTGKGTVRVDAIITGTEIGGSTTIHDYTTYWNAITNTMFTKDPSTSYFRPIIRVYNGFKIPFSNDGYSQCSWKYNGNDSGDGIWTVTFDYVTIDPNGVWINNELFSQFNNGSKVKIVHNTSTNVIQYYKNDELILSKSYTLKGFSIEPYGDNIVFDNLRIERTG